MISASSAAASDNRVIAQALVDAAASRNRTFKPVRRSALARMRASQKKSSVAVEVVDATAVTDSTEASGSNDMHKDDESVLNDEAQPLSVSDASDAGGNDDSAPAQQPQKKRKAEGRGSKPRAVPNRAVVQRRIGEYGAAHSLIQAPGGYLFCNACSCAVIETTTGVKRHIASEKHKTRLERKAHMATRGLNVMQHVLQWQADGKEMTKADQNKLQYRLMVLECFLRSGTPLSKLEFYRPLLEQNGCALTDRAHMSTLVPALMQAEIGRIKAELGKEPGQRIAVIFDGTTTVAEVQAVVIRWCDENFHVYQRLLHLGFYDAPMRVESIVEVLVDVLIGRYQLRRDRVLAIQNDRASVNEAAVAYIATVFPHINNLVCFSHVLNLCGQRLNVPVATIFLSHLIGCVRHGLKCKHAWREVTGSMFPRKSATRWWSEYECFVALHEALPLLPQFLAHPDAQDAANVMSMRDIWNNVPQRAQLRLELAAIRYSMRGLVKATYNLEGDKSIGFVCFDILNALKIEMETAFPGLEYEPLQQTIRELAQEAVAARMLQGLDLQQCTAFYTDMATNAVRGAAEYFADTVLWKLQGQLELYRILRLSNPVYFAQANLAVATIRQMLEAVAPLLPDLDLQKMLEERAEYYAAADGMQAREFRDISETLDAIENFWRGKRYQLPAWHNFARHVAILQPSSALVERVFSLLQSTFSDRQTRTLEDYVQTSIMLQFHDRKSTDAM